MMTLEEMLGRLVIHVMEEHHVDQDTAMELVGKCFADQIGNLILYGSDYYDTTESNRNPGTLAGAGTMGTADHE